LRDSQARDANNGQAPGPSGSDPEPRT
jgi:hypothetical protein